VIDLSEEVLVRIHEECRPCCPGDADTCLLSEFNGLLPVDHERRRFCTLKPDLDTPFVGNKVWAGGEHVGCKRHKEESFNQGIHDWASCTHRIGSRASRGAQEQPVCPEPFGGNSVHHDHESQHLRRAAGDNQGLVQGMSEDVPALREGNPHPGFDGKSRPKGLDKLPGLRGFKIGQKSHLAPVDPKDGYLFFHVLNGMEYRPVSPHHDYEI